MKLKTIVIMLLSMAIVSCVTNRLVGKNRVEQIVFGSGGGVTGKIVSYTLKSDGSLYRSNEFLRKISKKEVKPIFKKLSKVIDYKYSNPANMYQFIELTTDDSSNRIVWGFGDKNIDNQILESYKELKKFID